LYDQTYEGVIDQTTDVVDYPWEGTWGQGIYDPGIGTPTFGTFVGGFITDQTETTITEKPAIEKFKLDGVFKEDRNKIQQDFRDSKAIYIIGKQPEDSPIGSFRVSINTSEV